MKGKKSMCHKPFSQLVTTCVAVIALGVSTSFASFIELNSDGSGDPVVLADLLSGQVMGVTVGDKTFSEFFYSTLPGDDMPAPEAINVFGFMDESDNLGIRFHGVFRDKPGGGVSDALLEFTVEVSPEAAERGYRISDAHLFAGGIGLGDNSEFQIDESFQQNNATLNAGASTLGSQKQTKLSDWVFFDELYTRLRVTKDILADAGDDSGQSARATSIAQTFSQVVPEPATIGLMALALLGIVAGKRDR